LRAQQALYSLPPVPVVCRHRPCRRRAAIGQASGRHRAAVGPPSGRHRAAVGPPSGRLRAAVGPPSGRHRAAIGPPPPLKAWLHGLMADPRVQLLYIVQLQYYFKVQYLFLKLCFAMQCYGNAVWSVWCDSYGNTVNWEPVKKLLCLAQGDTQCKTFSSSKYQSLCTVLWYAHFV
jgi:hypothetical protein